MVSKSPVRCPIEVIKQSAPWFRAARNSPRTFGFSGIEFGIFPGFLHGLHLPGGVMRRAKLPRVHVPCWGEYPSLTEIVFVPF